MTKRIILLLLMMSFGRHLHAQTENEHGTSYGNPVPIGVSAGRNVFEDVHDTSTGPPWFSYCWYLSRDNTYKYTQGRAVYYRLEMPATGEVLMHNWNSEGPLAFTTIFLLKELDGDEVEAGEARDWQDEERYFRKVAMFEEMDFMSPDFRPENHGAPESTSRGHAYLHLQSLPAGVYYIVTAGYKYTNASQPNGRLRTTVVAELAPDIPGERPPKPFIPDNSPVQYQYDRSGNQIKTIKKQP